MTLSHMFTWLHIRTPYLFTLRSRGGLADRGLVARYCDVLWTFGQGQAM